MLKTTSNERKKGDSAPNGLKIQIEVPRKSLLVLLIVLAIPYLVGLGFLLSKVNWHRAFPTNDANYSEGAVACNPGPWGHLEYIPIKIETPEEFLSIQA